MAHYSEWKTVPPGGLNRRLIRFIGGGRGHARSIGEIGDFLDRDDIDPARWGNYLDSLSCLGYIEPVLFRNSRGAEGWSLSPTGLEAYTAIKRDKE